jgi:asparagine synthase (glutamine-hydrolysing)
MCGICGIVNTSPDNPVHTDAVRRMTRILAHRGPDDEGRFVEANAGLGIRRLSIIDRDGGRQPIFNEDGSIVIVFNGEIYNYAELTANLTASGHVFATRSDTEAILHAYEQYGDDCVDRLRGMFAFAIWDRKRRRLLLARDRLGVKPLYYYSGPDFLAFASEIKALLELPAIPREVNREALDLYLALRYVPGPQTMFRNISKLQPGHLLALENGRPRIRKYWDIRYTDPEPQPAARRVEQFQEILEESVRLRLISEVPLGVFLSGGIDSSAVLAVMSRFQNPAGIETFSVGYEASSGAEDRANEFSYAQLAAHAFGADLHEFRLGVNDFRDFMPGLAWYLDEPLADPTCIPLYFLSKLARRRITVVLSGEGADEVLAGYGIYWRMLALEGIYRAFPLAAALAPRLARLAPGEKAAGYVAGAGLPLEVRYRGVSRAMHPGLVRELLPDSGHARHDPVTELFRSCFRKVEQASPLNRMLYVDAKIWLPDDLLLKADKMTMANSLELRVPFLDHKLVEFTSTLPDRLKLRNGRGKALLREAMRGILPQPIVTRPKKGFPIPWDVWIRAPLKEFTRDVLLASGSACRIFMNPRALERIVRENERGAGGRHEEIWRLLVFEFWHKVFMERREKPASAPAARLAGAPHD